MYINQILYRQKKHCASDPMTSLCSETFIRYSMGWIQQVFLSNVAADYFVTKIILTKLGWPVMAKMLADEPKFKFQITIPLRGLIETRHMDHLEKGTQTN